MAGSPLTLSSFCERLFLELIVNDWFLGAKNKEEAYDSGRLLTTLLFRGSSLALLAEVGLALLADVGLTLALCGLLLAL